ncbi:MAG: Zn-dependent hydrolase [Thermoplasmata archaeon]|nr:MAG: Zn-dependent hydrolase [Thermoplasmata archaeon]
MIIRWHGHACFEVRNKIVLVFDPHDGKSIGIKPPSVKADLVLVSHDHFDHNAVRAVKGLTTKVISTVGKHRFDDIEIEGILTYHDEDMGRRRGKNTVFKVKMEGITLCHLGDLGHMLNDEQTATLGRPDIMFIPVGGTFTIDASTAWELIKKVKPRVAIPMHYRVGGLSLSIAPLTPFLEFVGEKNTVHVGNEVEFTKEDLPTETEVWVFSL